MRPKSIILFERLVLLSIVLSIIYTALVWDQLNAQVAATGVGSGAVIGIQVVTVALYLLLIWFISRRGSPIAKWIYVVLAGISLAFSLIGIGQTFEMGALPAIVGIMSYALSAVAIWLLFRPDAKAWFSDGRGGTPDPEVFR